MTNGSLIHMRRTGFHVNGKRRGLGLALLYQDKLAYVRRQGEVFGCFLGPFVLGLVYTFADDISVIAASIGVLAGGWLGQQVDRRTAARRVTRGGRGVTVTPLDSITSVRARPGGFLVNRSLVVMAKDGTEYRFYGRLDGWQADLAAALTVRGLPVHVTPGGITVTPQAEN